MRGRKRRGGFTLIELVVVLAIMAIAMGLIVPRVTNVIGDMPISDGAALLHASIEGARDAAIAASTRAKLGVRRGIRLIPDQQPARLADGSIDPARPLTSSTIIPLETPDPYAVGTVSAYPRETYPDFVAGGRACLILEHCPGKWEPVPGGYAWIVSEPSGWAWNIRVGETVVLGSKYVVTGPMDVLPGRGNPDQRINYGPVGTRSRLTREFASPDGRVIVASVDYLLLVNGRDDDRDGRTDEGWDGIDGDGDRIVDEVDEWEQETWGDPLRGGFEGMAYQVIRRPVPSLTRSEVRLPRGSLVDLTGWDGRPDRSWAVVNRYSGAVDLMIDEMGRWSYDLPYSGTSAIGMGRANAVHFWVGSPLDVAGAVSPTTRLKEGARLVSISKAGIVSTREVSPEDPARARTEAMRGAR